MQTLGDYLKKGREACNISLSDVSDYTKISKIYLNGLENDDFTKMPADLYVKGYISSYASCVGIDEQEALKLYDSFHIETSDAQDILAGTLPDTKDSHPRFFRLNKLIWFVLASCILTILAVGAYYIFFHNQKSAAVNKSLPEQNKVMPPAPISMTTPDRLQKMPAENSIRPIVQEGLEKKTENKKAGTEPDNGISQISDPLLPKQSELKSPLPTRQPDQSSQPPAHHPEQILKETVPDRSIPGYSGVNAVPGAGNDQRSLENIFKIIEAGACSSIENRIPRGFGDSFNWSVDRIYIWTRIECERPPSSIRHIYYFKGQKVNDILLNIRSSHWRTWSYKTLSNKRYIGPWRVDITTVEGNLLQSVHFEIK